MSAVRFRIEDVREAEQARCDFQTTAVALSPGAAAAPPTVVIRQQLWILRRDAKRKAARILGTRGVEAAKRLRVSVGSARRTAKAPPPAPSPPAVSVILTVFNNGPVLRRAIDSVLTQTMPDWELIIWDDGSSDRATLDVIENAGGNRVLKFAGPNQGVIGARSSAASKATGGVFVFLDPDDALDATYLEKVLITFARYPSVDVVCPAARVYSETYPDEYWYAGHFDEKALSYANTAPISSAMRRRVWEAIGGMPSEMSEGFEDWGFWRAAAGAGFRGWTLSEALFHYTHSDTTGRDATARKKRDDLERLLKQLNPSVTHQSGEIREDPAALRREINSRVFHFPNSDKPALVVLVPWMLHGGGAETFMLSTLKTLREDFDIVVIGTSSVPKDHVNATNEFLKVTPYVYDLASLVGQDALYEMMSSILYRLRQPDILLIGSPWAYEHMREIKQMSRGWGRIVDLQFNHLAHLPKLLNTLPEVDHVLVAHQRLQSLFLDYYEVSKPVDVLYIAPPEHDLRKYEGLREGRNRGRLRIGWLGRNSPEKRADLVATIAAALPEADFLMAGSALEQLPPQPDNVEIVGWVDDALEFLAGLDFVLNTSDIEGISVTAMEALRLGVPVLTRDVGGMAELVRDGHNGLVYDPTHLIGLGVQLRDPGLVEHLRATAEAERLPPAFHFDTMIDTLRNALLGKPIENPTEPGQQHSPQ